MKSFIFKLLTIGAALCFSLVLIELGVRFFVPVTDYPYTEYDPDVGVHLAPLQDGRTTMGALGEFGATYRINNAGWNSVHDYQLEKPEGTLRIAVIGDSFVEALGVDVDKGFQMSLERELDGHASCGGYDKVEVYSFGYSGIPMSQYVSIMRHAQKQYSPDAFIVNIFPINDFEASLKTVDDASSSHVLTYRPDDQGGFAEVPHTPYTPSRLKRSASRFATVRYAMLNLNIKAHPMIQEIMTPADFYGDVNAKDDALLERFTEFVFGEYQEIAGGKPLLIVADADRRKIYADYGLQPDDLAGVDAVDRRYFDYIEKAVKALDISYLPLHPVLEEDFIDNGIRFEFVSDGRTLDGHWNARANDLIGASLATWVQSDVCSQ